MILVMLPRIRMLRVAPRRRRLTCGSLRMRMMASLNRLSPGAWHASGMAR